MPARVASAAADSRAPTKPNRTRRPPPTADVDTEALANDLGRVLRVTQPKVVRKVATSTTKPTTAPRKPVAESAKPASELRPRAPVARPRTKVAPAPPPATQRTTTSVRATTSARPQPQSKVPTPSIQPRQYEDLPWMGKNSAMDISERAQAAKTAMAAAGTTLAEAAKANVVYGAAVAKGFKVEWSDARLDEAVHTFCAAVAVLRERFPFEEGSSARATLERGVATFVLRCTVLQMHQHILDIVTTAKPHVLQMYKHDAAEIETESIPSSSRHATLKELSSLIAFPPPTAELSDSARSIINTFVMAVWCSVLSMRANDPKMICALIALPTSSGQLHPFNLALSLPASTIATLSSMLYRHAQSVKVEEGTDEWLRMRLLTVFATATTVTAIDSHKRKNSPDIVWNNIIKTVERYLQSSADDTRQRRAAGFIDAMVQVVERICHHRSEPREGWFTGNWSKVLEIWVGIGRGCRSKSIINRAISLSGQSDQASQTLSEEAARLAASLTKVTFELSERIKEEDWDASAIQASLDMATLESMLHAMCALDTSDDETTTLQSSLREVERLRRAVVQIFHTSEVQPSLRLRSRDWLLQYLAFSEALLEKAANKPPCASLCVPGSLDTTLRLVRPGGLNGTSITQIDLLDKARALLQTYGTSLAQVELSKLYYALGQASFGEAIGSNRQGLKKEAVAFAQRTCDWYIEAIEGSQPDSSDASRQAMMEAMPKRFEYLGVCFTEDDRNAALKAFCQGLAWLPPNARQKISKEAASAPLTQVSNDANEFSLLLNRCATLLAAEAPPFVDFSGLLWDTLQEWNFTIGLCGIYFERMMDYLQPSLYRPLVQDTFTQLGNKLLEIYNAETYPIRRMRTNVRMMNLIVTTGLLSEQFESLFDDVNALWESQTAGEDAALAPYKAEYYASALMLRALHCHYNQPEGVDNVALFGKAALGVARRLVFPPPTTALGPKKTVARSRTPASAPARATRTPARTATARKAPAGRKVVATKQADPAESALTNARIGDPEQFAQLLQSLSSLFSISGHMVSRIETLNIIRAMQKSSETTVDGFILTSAQLGAEYGRLGKQSRAAQVFTQAIKHDSTLKEGAQASSLVILHLRYAHFLALSGHVAHAREHFQAAEKLSDEVPPITRDGTKAERWVKICGNHERSALAHTTYAAISMATGDMTRAIASLAIAYRQYIRAANAVAELAADVEPATDEQMAEAAGDQPRKKKAFSLEGKHLGGLQWQCAEAVFESTFAVFTALAQRGSPKECDYYIAQARGMVAAVGSSTLQARTATHAAELESRRLHFETSVEQLELAADVLAVDGPDAVDIQRIRGELYSRQDDPEEADEMFAAAVERLCGLDGEFAATEAMTSATTTVAPSPKSPKGKEPLLPHALGHVLRQRAWLLREAGDVDEYDAVVQQLNCLPQTTGDKPEQLLLEAKVAMHEAFSHFKTDLFMSSLTESTIAMTMGAPEKRAKERQSTRQGALMLLEKASQSFRKTLSIVARTGRVEDVRQACISLVLLGAFQTALGYGSPTTTALAAGILASVPALTLHRELFTAVDNKYPDPEADDFDWPGAQSVLYKNDNLGLYWEHIRSKHEAFDFLHADYDLSCLPENWAVVGITVTTDRSTMLVSRHQNGHEPLVFCIPLDRQGRREGDDESELFTFDAGVAEFNAIIEGSHETIRGGSKLQTMEEKQDWWNKRKELDKRLESLLATIEFCWLGAFKTVLNPRLAHNPKALNAFRDRLDGIFQAALSASGSETRRGAKVKLNDTLLACFATLQSSSKDEEIEDLVYFILDFYQSHGIAVALAELDFDQIGVDVKSALSDLEMALGKQPPNDEHLLLALDKNVQLFPWESIPILRGRAVSRIPSLPFLLDQVHLSQHLNKAPGHFTIDPSNAQFFLNPSGDLRGTQERLSDRLTTLEKRGWKGIRGTAPSQDDMINALSSSDLVMYFGHGGGEQYISGTTLRSLPRCAVTMLWGCSSGILRDQGDLDRTGTPNDYVLAGSPCLVANLWDVTDKDCDRLTAAVMDGLGLGGGRYEGISVVQAVSKARTVTNLPYLTGGAAVVYGVPVYLEQ